MSNQSDISLVFAANPQRPAETVLGDRFAILPDSPISELDAPGTQAFVATDLKDGERPMFARVCEPGISPRIETMVQLKGMADLDVMRPMDWGPVYWPPDGRRKFVVVFDRPERAAAMPSLSAHIQPLSADIINRAVFDPIVVNLMQMTQRGVTCRALRPDNLYPGAHDDSPFTIGDFVTTPPAWGQPAIMEPIESAMASRWARGAGDIGDDMYALGATILFLALGYCPVVEMDDKSIIAAKMQQGSFTTLLGGQRPPFGLRDPLRGLLCDDPTERWAPDDVYQFLGGGQHRSVSQGVHVTSDRPFNFNGKDYKILRGLAWEFGDDWQAAGSVITNERFDKWLRRGLSDSDFPDEQEKILTKVGLTLAGGQDARAVSQICAIMDPSGPFYFKGLSINPAGLGSIFTHAYCMGQNNTIEVIAESINDGAIGDWIEFHEKFLGENWSAANRAVNMAERMMKRKGPGFGPERALYELNSFAPCMSPFISAAYAYTLNDLLVAMESYISEKGGLPTLIDRHVMGFLGARLKGLVNQDMIDLNKYGSDSVDAKLCVLKILGEVQENHGPTEAPNLTKLFADELESVLDRFLGKTLRNERRESLADVVATGKLFGLFLHLSDPKVIKRDNSQYKSAKREYAVAGAKIQDLQSDRFSMSARRDGWRVAAGISAFIASCTVALLVVS